MDFLTHLLHGAAWLAGVIVLFAIIGFFATIRWIARLFTSAERAVEGGVKSAGDMLASQIASRRWKSPVDWSPRRSQDCHSTSLDGTAAGLPARRASDSIRNGSSAGREPRRPCSSVVERVLGKDEAAGSIPAEGCAKSHAPVAQLDRAMDS